MMIIFYFTEQLIFAVESLALTSNEEIQKLRDKQQELSCSIESDQRMEQTLYETQSHLEANLNFKQNALSKQQKRQV